jgi:hypothetical protein
MAWSLVHVYRDPVGKMVARSMPLGRSDPRNGENHGKKNPKISEENPMILYVEDDFHVFVFFLVV